MRTEAPRSGMHQVGGQQGNACVDGDAHRGAEEVVAVRLGDGAGRDLADFQVAGDHVGLAEEGSDGKVAGREQHFPGLRDRRFRLGGRFLRDLGPGLRLLPGAGQGDDGERDRQEGQKDGEDQESGNDPLAAHGGGSSKGAQGRSQQGSHRGQGERHRERKPAPVAS